MKYDIREVSMTAILAALFVVLGLIPFSVFIGGPAMITAAIVVVPLMAYILSPTWAFVSGAMGGLVTLAFMTGYGPVMGPYTILIPSMAACIGSIGFHSKGWKLIIPPMALLGELLIYIVHYDGQATLLWGVHYVIAIVIFAVGVIMAKVQVKNPIAIVGNTAITTMMENAMLNLGSMFIIALPATLWTVIAPASWMERTLATIGSVIIITAIDKSKILSKIGWNKN